MESGPSSSPNSNRSLMWVLGLLGGFIIILVIAIVYLLISRSTASVLGRRKSRLQ